MELAQPKIIEVPARWTLGRFTPETAAIELQALGEVLNRGCEALGGLYMRMCDLIRSSGLSDSEVRKALDRHFPEARISEILRVSRAPEQVYLRYRAGFFGFKAALRECRGYQVTPTGELTRRKVRRAAQRLVALMPQPGELAIGGRVVSVR
jgi:hypothetical protein